MASERRDTLSGNPRSAGLKLRALQSGTVPLGDYKRAGGFIGLRRLIARHGGDPSEMLRAAGLSSHDLDDHDAYLHYPSVIRLLESCATDLKAAFFGFELGRSQTVDVLGPLATLLLAAPTVGEGLALMARYMPVHAPGALFESRLTEVGAHVTYRVLHPQMARSRQINELSMAVAFGIIRSLVGRDLRAMEVHIASDPPPRRLDGMETFFGTSVDYSCPVSGLVLPTAIFDKAVDGSNPALLNASLRFMEMIARDRDGDIVDQVRRIVRRLLPTGGCSLAVTAMHLALQPRVLQLRLERSGTDFRELLSEEREKLAKAYLDDARTPLAEIAMLLGYADQASFTRAFSGWTAQSPLRYRKAALQGRGG